jgi:hypothetical protein
MVALEALDLVYPKGFSAEEGSLYLAYLSYSTFVREHEQAAVDHNRLMLRPQPALRTFMQDAAFQSPLNGYCFFLQR